MIAVTFEDAVSSILEIAKPLEVKLIPIEQTANHVLAQPLIARSASPRTNVSAMDGYAVRNADFANAQAKLPVVGTSSAGSPPDQVLEPGTAMRIYTGAPIPVGADRVVIQENVERVEDVITVTEPLSDKTNIRAMGSDFAEGDILLEQGQFLHWRAMTTAAAADWSDLKVYRRPRVVIIATGDELEPPGTAHLTPGAISESVSLGVAALVEQYGADLIKTQCLPDDPDVMSSAAKSALDEADVVVMIGGASVGDRDYSRSVFGDDVDYVFPKVAIKPGKPVWLAKVQSKLIMGLPGNPTSALVTGRLFLAPLIMGLSGQNPSNALKFQQDVCLDELPANAGRETFLRAKCSVGRLRLLSSQDSSSQKMLADADVLIRRPAHAPKADAGSLAPSLLF